MGELIKRDVPDKPMQFTGERFTSAVSGQTAIEHVHRALMARSFCLGKDVLDIACGEGYCSALLSAVARSVVGVDISSDAISHARATYGRENITFKEGTATEIPASDDSFDIVVSFETIEHFAEHTKFMKEVRRVLRPTGILIISTPDPTVYSPEGQPANPYHVKELSRDEFNSLIGEFFPHIAYLGQRTLIGSALIKEDVLTKAAIEAPFITYETRAFNAFERSNGLPRAKYLVAIAGNSLEALSNFEQSLFISTSEIDASLSTASDLQQELMQMRSELTEKRALEHRLISDIETVTGWFKNAEASAEILRSEGTRLDRELTETKSALNNSLELDRTLVSVIETVTGRLEDAETALLSSRADAIQQKQDFETFKATAEDERTRLLSELIEVRQNLSSTQTEIGTHKAEHKENRVKVDRIGESYGQRTWEANEALHNRIISGHSVNSETVQKFTHRATAAAKRGDMQSAEDFYKLAAVSSPGNGKAWRNYAACLNRKGAHKAALSAWHHAVTLNTRDAIALDGLGATLTALGHLAEGLSVFKEAFTADPSLSGPRQRLEESGVSSAQMADFILSSQLPATKFSRDIGGEALRLIYEKRARYAERKGKLKSASRIYKELADNSSNSTSLVKYGDKIVSLTGHRSAVSTYFKACSIAPEDPRARRRVSDVKFGNSSFKLIQKTGIRKNDDGTYFTLSEDPQFVLDPDGCEMPRGWTLFTLSAQTFDTTLRPVLYAWYGEGARLVMPFTLPAISATDCVECLLPLPVDTKYLRLDPTTQSGVHFRLDRVGWLSSNALEGRLFQPAPNSLAFVGEHLDEVSHISADFDPQPLNLAPKNDLKVLGNGLFHSTGDDPQFSVTSESRLPSGWTWMVMRVDAVDAALNPVLYVWTENEVVAITLPAMRTAGTTSFLVRLPEKVSSLRLDPTSNPGVNLNLGGLFSCPAPDSKNLIFVPLNTEGDLSPSAGITDATTLELRPVSGLQVVDQDFVAENSPAEFVAHLQRTSIFSGPVEFSIEVKHASRPLDITLYVDDASNKNRTREYRFSSIEAARKYSFYILLPETVNKFRLFIHNTEFLTLSCPNIIFTRLDYTDGALYLPINGHIKSNNLCYPTLVPDLTPSHQVAQSGEVFRSTGDDPQFEVSFLEGEIPTGWKIVTVAMDVNETVVRPVLHVWVGDQVSSIQLAPLSGNANTQQLVCLPEGATAMRFDPVDQADIHFSPPLLTFTSHAAFAGSVLRRHSYGSRDLDYEAWCSRYDELSSLDLSLLAASAERLSFHPLISVVMPVYNPEIRFLCRALDTVLAQTYPHWELCIAEDCSPNEEIRSTLRDYAARDSRIKVVFRQENGHISLASNSALELVTGSFVALMDHDDELPAHALYMVAREINLYPLTDVIYTDEDKIDANGRRHDPYFKTDWNQELFYSQNMVAHLGVYRTSLVREVGGFRAGFEGSQDYDFTLRVLRLTSSERIRHIPHVLYHWRIFEGVRTFSSNNPQRSVDTAGKAMQEYFASVEPDSQVIPVEAFPGWWRIKRSIVRLPSVTIVIPTRDRIELVRNCIEGLLNRTDYPNFDVIIVDNGSVEPESLAYFASLDANSRVRVHRDDGPFNYSRLNNEAVYEAQGEYVCFLNNDIEVIDTDWLMEMMAQALRPGVGAVGTKLLYENGRIQHAGVTLGLYGVAAHGHRHFPNDSIGYFGHPQLVREVSAVTGATLLMPKALFNEIGGFDAKNLAVSYNDVDLCLRIGEAGYRVIYTPFAALYHLESATRGPDVRPEQQELQRIERGYMQARWGQILEQDPHYNPNLTLTNEDYHLAFPPRARRAWLEEADVAERLARSGLENLPAPEPAELAALCADTVVVIASQAPFEVLTALSYDIAGTGLSPAAVVLVDNTARRDAFAREGTINAFRAIHPFIPLRIIDDPSQDFNNARTANLGLAAIEDEARHVVMILEDCTFTSGWLYALLTSWLAAADAHTVLAPHIFVRENEPRNGVLTDGFIEIPVKQIVSQASDIAPVAKDYHGLPRPERLSPEDAVNRHATLEETPLLASGIIMAQRTVIMPDPAELAFDPLFLTLPACLEDIATRVRSRGATIRAALAPLAILKVQRARDIIHLWQYWHDYLWLNRKVHGLGDNSIIEFICPFHRGDVLIGLQVANTAFRTGRHIRFHVAEALLGWVADFAPPFPVEALPVPVPPAHETALYLLRSYEHVVARSDTSPRIARSHPIRSLDNMNSNLATAMLAAVGLPSDTLIESLVPKPTSKQIAEIEELLRPYGKNVVLLHRSGGWGLKSLPDNVLAKFATLVKEEGFRLVQIGGPGDEPCREADGIIAKNLSAGHWAALFRMASLVAGVDSWSSHMAAILDVPQITFYGSTHPDHVASKPYFQKKNAPVLLIPPTVTCSPCNSLTCLIQPKPFCPGYSADPTIIVPFLHAIKLNQNEN